MEIPQIKASAQGNASQENGCSITYEHQFAGSLNDGIETLPQKSSRCMLMERQTYLLTGALNWR